ncbi:MAG: TRAP transporter TatT component family protein [Thermoanaerobaculia bacterium]
MRWLLLGAATVVFSACSLRNLAVDKIGNVIAAGGITFASDEDPDLVGDALPFSLKFIESLLAERPQHRPLLLAAASGFTQYSYGWVDGKADELALTDVAGAEALQRRARRLYLRARDYGLRGLGTTAEELRTNRALLRLLKREDVPLLYWTASSWALAIARSKDDPETVADLPIVEALIGRAAELDPDWDQGAIDAFLITWEASHDRAAEARSHFDRAVRLSDGKLASPYVALAEGVCVATQNRAEFRDLLETALRVDPDARPEWRLQNVIARRRAEWLLAHADDYFLEE